MLLILLVINEIKIKLLISIKNQIIIKSEIDKDKIIKIKIKENLKIIINKFLLKIIIN